MIWSHNWTRLRRSRLLVGLMTPSPPALTLCDRTSRLLRTRNRAEARRDGTSVAHGHGEFTDNIILLEANEPTLALSSALCAPRRPSPGWVSRPTQIQEGADHMVRPAAAAERTGLQPAARRFRSRQTGRMQAALFRSPRAYDVTSRQVVEASSGLSSFVAVATCLVAASRLVPRT